MPKRRATRSTSRPSFDDWRFNDGSYRRFLTALFSHLTGVQREHALLKTFQHITAMMDESLPETDVEDATERRR
jgi:hypothetical protein